jgi:AcrR family transcriptional regulator
MNAAAPALSLRDRQREVTRDLILNAVAGQLARGDLRDLTFADLAEKAGVSERTIYRHFATKEELLEVFWVRMHAQLGAARARTGPQGPIWQAPLTSFPYLDKHEALLRAVISSPEAKDARAKLSAARQPDVRRAVLAAVGPLPEPDFTYVCAAVQLLTAPVAWQAFKDDYGLSGAEGGKAASLAIKALLDAVRPANAPQPTEEAFGGTPVKHSGGEP